MLKKLFTFLGLSFSIALVSFGQTNTWLKKSDFGTAPRSAPVAFSIGSKGYLGTGADANYKKDFWEYDPTTNVWTQKADFGGTARQNAFGFAINTKGYIGLGTDGFNSYRKDFWEYDPTTNTWTRKADFAGTARHRGLSFAVGNKGYVGLGEDATTRPVDFYEYNPALDTWTQKANFPGNLRISIASFSTGIFGYACTGYVSFNASNECWQYNTTADSWVQKAYFPGANRSGAVGFSIGTLGYIGGGYSSNINNDFYEYNTLTNTWKQIDNATPYEIQEGASFTIGNYGYIYTGYYGSNPFQNITGNLTNENKFYEYGPHVATVASWVGTTNTDWNSVSNWDIPTLPTKIDNAVVLAGNFNPTIKTRVFLNSLTVAGGATITVNTNSLLSVSGTFLNLGTICRNGGSIVGTITGNAVQNAIVPSVSLSVLPLATVPAFTTLTISAIATNTGGMLVNYGFLVNNVLQQFGTTSSFYTSTLTSLNTITSFITLNGAGCVTKTTATASSWVVSVTKLPQTTNFLLPATVNFGSAPLTLTGVASSALPVTYQSSNTSRASISGGNVLQIRGAGTVTITAFQTGNAYYQAAPSVPQLLVITKADQSINLVALPTKSVGDPSFKLISTASSGLVVAYSSSNLAVASISGNTVVIVGAGTTTITGTQAGNANYNPAQPVTQVLVVAAPTLLEDATIDQCKIFPNPAKGMLNVTGIATAFKISMYDLMGKEIWTKEAVGKTSVDVSSLLPGEYLVKITTTEGSYLKKCLIE